MATVTSTPVSEPLPASDIDAVERAETTPLDEAPRLKGRKRLLHNLQRISSSSSLSLGRRRANSSPYTGRNLRGSALNLLSSSSNSSFSRLVHGHNGSTPAPSSGTPLPVTPSPLATVQSNDDAQRSLVEHLDLISAPAPPIDEFATDDYFSQRILNQTCEDVKVIDGFDFWGQMPHELRLYILQYLQPKELVRASLTSRSFHQACFDGQLWTRFDATEFYTQIPAESLAKIVEAAGPFVKDLNLRGCVQVQHYNRADVVVRSCRNLKNATLEGCRNFQRSTLHTLLSNNSGLTHINLTGLVAVNNGTCKIVSRSCPQLESFNVSWCSHMDSKGIKMVLLGCRKIRDLRVAEMCGLHGSMGLEVARLMFEANTLERLVLSGCSDLSDDVLMTMMHGTDPEYDIVNDVTLVEPRRLRHLDLTRCSRLTDTSVNNLAHNLPYLEVLQLAGCVNITDVSLSRVIGTVPYLTHLDLEELSGLSDNFLAEHLAKAPCACRLENLSIPYCEHLGDNGMLPVMRNCTNLQSVDMDNTQVSNSVLAEAAAMVRRRSAARPLGCDEPQITLRLVVYDCSNVTWAGVKEVLKKNAEPVTVLPDGIETVLPSEVIGLKCFYGWQQTVDEHMKRVLRGDQGAANRLATRWAQYMMAQEEAGIAGINSRRRRRRAREAALLHTNEEGGERSGIGRRRARTSACILM